MASSVLLSSLCFASKPSPSLPSAAFAPRGTLAIPRFLPSQAKAKAKTAARANARGSEFGEDPARNALLRAVLWGSEATYIAWLFLLPYAPGDPVWAISSASVNDVINLSLNFFFVLPVLNSVGVHVVEAPVLHPVSEGLFNFVIGWTLLFAPLLFTDCKRGRFKGSLELLWGMQMFLTNVFLIPYMAIRLEKFDSDDLVKRESPLASTMTRGAKVVGIIGSAICILSLFWCIAGRADGDYGGFSDRFEYLKSYIGSERLAYAFMWDIVLYSIFQPWLIGDNIGNLKERSGETVSKLRFIPVAGLVAYLLNLDDREEF